VNAWPYGDLCVLEALWQQLGIAEVIGEIAGWRRFDFSVERTLFAMVNNRACARSPKLYSVIGSHIRLFTASSIKQ
jgi:hypothetical protein